MEVEYIEGELR